MNELSTRKRLDILAIAAECLHECGCGDEQIANTLSLDRAAIPLLLDRLRSLRRDRRSGEQRLTVQAS